MAATGPSALPLTRSQLLISVSGAIVIAGVILLGAVLPAEFGRDPIGLGRLIGTSRLWQPTEAKVSALARSGPLARDYPTAFRTDIIDIPIADFESGRPYELEYKVRQKKGATLVYSWTVSGAAKPEDFYSEFHGHTVSADKTMTVADYRKASGLAANGSLVAPFDGVHGWYFQNSAPGPVVVHLRVSGFYDLIPPGQVGNEARIEPVSN